MNSILQKNLGWPTTGTHRCLNIGCDKTVYCNPYNSALCTICFPIYLKSESFILNSEAFPFQRLALKTLSTTVTGWQSTNFDRDIATIKN